MRFVMTFKIPHQAFHKHLRSGVAAQKIGRIVEETRPEHIYFFERDGVRAGLAVYDLKDAAGVCAVAEPWFLTFHAECEFTPAMTPEDLSKSGMDELGRKWA